MEAVYPLVRFVDKLVKVFRLDGHEEWLLVHIEVQGHADKQFPERMFRYYYRIFDRYQQPITAIVFLRNYILFEDQQTNSIFDMQIDLITGKKNSMGLIEQIAEMRVQETREADMKQFVTNLLLDTDFSVEKIASLSNVSVSFVEEVKESLCTK